MARDSQDLSPLQHPQGELHNRSLCTEEVNFNLLVLLFCFWIVKHVHFDSVTGSLVYYCMFLVLQEWVYYLNEGSQINISYSVTSPSSSSLVLVIVEGKIQFSGRS